MKSILNKFRKLRHRLVVDYYYKARGRFNPIGYLRLLREAYSVQEIRKNHPLLYKEVCSVLSKSDSTGGEWSDYLCQYESVRNIKPSSILELGSGISSVVFSFALKENFKETGIKGHLYSIEENEFYYNQIKSIFPVEYEDYVDFFLRARKEKRFQGILGSYYEDLPELNYDFIYIDGPTDRADKNSEKTFNADLVNIMNNNSIGKFTAILDQRVFTYWSLKKLLPNIKIKYDVVKKVSFIYPKK